MSPLQKKIEDDFKAAMKAKSPAYPVISFLRAAIKQTEVDSRKELTEEDVVAILRSQIKKRKESIEEYTKGGRPELADKEMLEMKVLEGYLPAQMPEADIRKIVVASIAEMGVAGDMSKMGQVVGKVMAQVKGKTDGGSVSKLVKEELAKK